MGYAIFIFFTEEKKKACLKAPYRNKNVHVYDDDDNNIL